MIIISIIIACCTILCLMHILMFFNFAQYYKMDNSEMVIYIHKIGYVEVVTFFSIRFLQRAL